MPINDYGDRIEYENVDLRLTGTSGILNRSAVLFNHFTGTAAAAFTNDFTAAEEGAATPFAILADTAGGAVRAVTGASSGNNQEMASAIGWLPSKGGLVFETRVTLAATTLNEVVVGLTDAKSYADIAFSLSAGSAITSVPVNGVALMYSATPTSGAAFNAAGNPWVGLGVKANTDTALVVPATAEYAAASTSAVILRIEVQADGGAVFFVNNQRIGSVLNATTASTQLAAYIGIATRTAAAKTLTVDYVYCKQGL